MTVCEGAGKIYARKRKVNSLKLAYQYVAVSTCGRPDLARNRESFPSSSAMLSSPYSPNLRSAGVDAGELVGWL